MTKNSAAGARRYAEVGRHAADQEARRQPGVLEIHASIAETVVLPCVPARPAPSAAQHVLAHHCGPETKGHRHRGSLHQRIAASDHVADHEQVRREAELPGAVAFDQLNAAERSRSLIGG